MRLTIELADTSLNQMNNVFLTPESRRVTGVFDLNSTIREADAAPPQHPTISSSPKSASTRWFPLPLCHLTESPAGGRPVRTDQLPMIGDGDDDRSTLLCKAWCRLRLGAAGFNGVSLYRFGEFGNTLLAPLGSMNFVSDGCVVLS